VESVHGKPCAPQAGGGASQDPDWHVLGPQQVSPAAHDPWSATHAAGGARQTPDWQVFGVQQVLPLAVQEPFSATQVGCWGLDPPPELQADAASARHRHSERRERSMDGSFRPRR
jgi:hypothetical protein